MSRYTKIPVYFPLLKLRVISTGFDYAGEEDVINLSRPQPSDPSIKSILTSGSFRVEFPNTDTPAIVSPPSNKDVWSAAVWPVDSAVGKSVVKTTALVDNTEWQCVQPFDGYTITNTEYNLSSNETLSIDPGVLIFVFGNNYKINDTSYSGFKMFAIQNSTIIISAIEVARIVSFKAVAI